MEGLKRVFKPLFSLLFLLFACQETVHGQLNVDLQLPRRQFLAYEALPVSVRLTNRAGQELLLHGDGRRPWLNIQVLDQRGNQIAPYRPLSFQAAKVPVGRSVAKQIDLASLFPLTNYGKYTVSTVVSLPTGETFQSTRKTFDVTQGRIIYRQRVGLGGNAREYRLITFSPGRTAYLYFQAELVDKRQIVLTYPIGEILRNRTPEATVDKSGRLNVLYLASPERHVHVLIDSEGKVVKRTLYKRGASGKPRLVAFANGEVQVAGGVKIDLEAQRAQRAKIRKISERPTLLLE